MKKIRQIKDSNPFNRFFLVKEGLFKNKKKLLTIYKEGIIVQNLEETEKEEFFYEDIVNVVSGEESKDFSIVFKDHMMMLSSKDGESNFNPLIQQQFTENINVNTQPVLNQATYSVTNLQFKPLIINEILKQVDVFNKSKEGSVVSSAKFSCYIFFNDGLRSFFSCVKETGKVNFIKPNFNAFIIDTTLSVYRSMIEWISHNDPSKGNREMRLKLCEITNICIYSNCVLKLETYNNIDVFIASKSLEQSSEIVKIIRENSKANLYHEINLDNVDKPSNLLTPVSQFTNLKQSSLLTQFELNRLLMYSLKQSVIIAIDKDNFYEITFEESAQNSQVKQSSSVPGSYLSQKEVSKCIKFVKIPLTSISYLVQYNDSMSKDFFEIILHNNARYNYQSSLKEKNEIISIIIDILSSGIKSQSSTFAGQSRPILLLNSKPKLENRVTGFPNQNENDIEYDKYTIKKLINIFSVESSGDPEKPTVQTPQTKNQTTIYASKQEADSQKVAVSAPKPVQTAKESIIEEVSLNFCFSSFHFKHEFNGQTNKYVFKNFYDYLEKEVNKLEKHIASKDSLIAKLQPANSISPPPLSGQTKDQNQLKIQNPEEEYETKKKKLTMTINFALSICRYLLVKFNYDKLLQVITLICNKIESQTIFYNSLSIFIEVLPTPLNFREEQTQDLMIVQQEDNAQKKWIISVFLENGLLLKNILNMKLFVMTEKGKNLKPNWEESTILTIYTLFQVIKHVHLFSATLNMVKGSNFKEFSSFDFLYNISVLLKSNSLLLKQVALELLLALSTNLSYDQEFRLKQTILSESLIFFQILQLYINPGNEEIAKLGMRFLKIFLISHVEATNLLINLFPRPLFYLDNAVSSKQKAGKSSKPGQNQTRASFLTANKFKDPKSKMVNNKPNPINWLDHEWNTFFGNINKNYYSIKLIWNDETRQELSQFLNSVISSFSEFSEDSSVVKSMFLCDTELKLNINLNNENNSLNQGYIPDFLNTALIKEGSDSNHINKSGINLITSFFCVNYKEIRKAEYYNSLSSYHLVYKYYLKILIQEDQGIPCFTEEIEDPSKFWEKLINELLITDSSKVEKIQLIIKSLSLLYRDYSDIIGVFKYYNHFISFFNQKNEKNEINEFIIQLILTSLECNDRETKKQNIELFIDSSFISEELIFQFLDHLLYFNNKFLYKNCLDFNEKEFFEESLAKFRWNDKFFSSYSGGGFFNLPSRININGDIISDENVGSSQPASGSGVGAATFTVRESDYNLMNFLDNKNLILKNLLTEFTYDKTYNNFTKYQFIHYSFNKGDKTIKCLTFILRIFKIVLKRYKLISDSLSKIYFPIPRIKHSFLKKENFFKIVLLLFINNSNLVLETLDLLLNYLNDPITYKEVIHTTNLPHILVFYLIKFRSNSIMKFIENMNYYNTIIFAEQSAQPNKTASISNYNYFNSKLSLDEQVFFKLYPEANRILLRYIPHNLLYLYMKTNIHEMMRVLFCMNSSDLAENQVLKHCELYLIWNRNMLKSLIETLATDMRRFLAGEFAKNLRANENSQNLKFSQFQSSIYTFDLDFKMKYDSENKQKCLIYYLKEYDKQLNQENLGIELSSSIMASIEDSHIEPCVGILFLKIGELISKNENYYDKEKAISEICTYLSFLKIMVYKSFYIIKDEVKTLEQLVYDIIYNYSYVYADANKKMIVKLTSDIVITSFNNLGTFDNSNSKNLSQKLNIVTKIICWILDEIGSIVETSSLQLQTTQSQPSLVKEKSEPDQASITIDLINQLIQLLKALNYLIFESKTRCWVVEILESKLTSDFLSNFHKVFHYAIFSKEKSAMFELTHLQVDLLFQVFNFLELLCQIKFSSLELVKSNIYIELILFCFLFASASEKDEEKETEKIEKDHRNSSCTIWSDISLKVNHFLAINSSRILSLLKYNSYLANDKAEAMQETITLFSTVLKNIFPSIFLELLSSVYDNIFLNQIANEEKAKIQDRVKDSMFTYEVAFLKSLKNNFEEPEFIWNKQLRMEAVEVLTQCLMKINMSEIRGIVRRSSTAPIMQPQDLSTLRSLSEFKYVSYENELKIEGIYIRIYNSKNDFYISDYNKFLKLTKDLILQTNEIEEKPENHSLINELLLAANNCLQFHSKADEKIMINDESFVDKLHLILKSSKVCDGSLHLLFTLSYKSENSINFLINTIHLFTVINRIIYNTELSQLQPIIKLFFNFSKNLAYIDKINISVFLLLLKKVFDTRSNTAQFKYYITVGEESSPRTRRNQLNLRVEILKLIKAYLKIDVISSTLKSVLEIYLPQIIIEMIFSFKEISEDSLTWIDNNYEYPNLIWNDDTISKSNNLIAEDCKFIIHDEGNLVNFPKNLFEYKIDRLQHFFFEISQEYIVDNIYVRVYNTQPSYNINKPLILFMKHLFNSIIVSFTNYGISSAIISKHKQFSSLPANTDQTSSTSTEMHEDLISQSEFSEIQLISQVFYSKTVIGLTSLLLILEQIIHNDFNDNLIVSSPEYLSEISDGIIKDETEKQLIQLVQRAIDNKTLIPKQFLVNMIELISILLRNDPFKCLSPNIRIILLQILYLLSGCKDYASLFESIEYIELSKELLKNPILTDIEIVLILDTINKLISYEPSMIPAFITDMLDIVHQITTENGREHVALHMLRLVTKISYEVQYGDSILYLIKNSGDKYMALIPVLNSGKSIMSEGGSLWRKGPDSREQAEIAFKVNHQSHFYDDSRLEEKGQIHSFELKFPVLSESSRKLVSMDLVGAESLTLLNQLSSKDEVLKKQELHIESYRLI